MISSWMADKKIVAKVTFKNVTKAFGKQGILEDFSLEVRDQEFLVLVGPSGCGKSTTLRLLAGLEEPTNGEIWIGDRCVNNIDPKDRDIAMVFQNYALYPHYSVRENLAFGLKLRRVPKAEIEKKVLDIAAMLELTSLLDRKPKALSGGQRQRVALGRAIIRHPKAFLMDEPLSNLDAKLRVQMRAELLKLQRRLRATTIYVTHDQVEAMTMGERIVVLHDGVIQQVGTPEEVYHRPANKFVAGFMGAPPMNFLERGKLTLGVRPENIRFEKPVEEGPEPWHLKGEFELVEPLGAEYLYHLLIYGAKWVIRSSHAYSFKPSQMIDLYVSADHIHHFDNENGGRRLEKTPDETVSTIFPLKKAA